MLETASRARGVLTKEFLAAPAAGLRMRQHARDIGRMMGSVPESQPGCAQGGLAGRLCRGKSPEESKYKFDYYQLLATIPGNEAFKPQEEGGCSLLSKK